MTTWRERLRAGPLNPDAWGYGLFWAWNVVFLAFMSLGFAPALLPEMVAALRRGDIPTMFVGYGVVLTLIPAFAMAIGWRWLRQAPTRLFALGYGVEGPLMLLVAVRFFAVRELTAAMGFMLAVAGLGIATFLWQLLDRGIDRRGAVLSHARVAGLTFLLVTGIYVSVWLAFYAVPLGNAALELVTTVLGDVAAALRDLWRSLAEMELRWLPFAVLGSISLAFSATLFVAMPVAIIVLYVRAWAQGASALVARHGRARAALVTVVTLVLCEGLFVHVNRQPQARAFDLLDRPPATAAEARALVSRSDEIRAGLLNAYLAPFRYFSARGEVRHIYDIYRSDEPGLGLSDASAARVQAWYEWVVQPLLYQPVHAAEAEAATGVKAGGRTPVGQGQALRMEPVQAAERYERFFDHKINEAERPAVVRAARSTWSVAEAQRAWRAVDDREVHLSEQSVTVAPRGDWAEVEIYEVYRNRTTERQEVVYYFSLPESAVVTGVWLGNTADRRQRYTFRVSPRGAAQELYQSEVRYQRDPALVEQIGPRQYRLRVFPIEPQRWDGGRGDAQMPVLVDGPPMHLWLTYRVMASGDAWPLPALAERRNVYWDAGSVRQVDGVNIPGDAEAWLPDVVSAGGPIEPAAHRVAFPNGETVIARPVGSDGAAAADLPLPPDLRLAVILDRSRSMEARAAEVAAALATLRGRVGSPAGADAPGVSDAPAGSDIPSGTDTSAASDPPAPIDVYLTASTYRGEAPSLVDLETLDMAEMLYFGGQNPAEMLAQFGSLRTGRPYDAILVLTDDSSYTKPPEGLAVPVPDAPLWMVHLGGAFPPGYDDDTLQALQASGGGAAASIEEALARLAAGRAPLARTAATTVPDDVVAATSATIETHGASDIVDGYIWSVVATEDLADVDAPGMALDGMAPGAAGWSSVPVSLRAADIAPIPTDPSFAALAARRVILAAMQRTRGGLGAAENLDGLHAIAVDQGIVTPYSSMIVLVNDEQHRRLTELEKGADRFERSFEEFGETEEANPMAVTAVPEPEEWLLMIVAAGVLAWYAYGERNRRRMWGVG